VPYLAISEGCRLIVLAITNHDFAPFISFPKIRTAISKSTPPKYIRFENVLKKRSSSMSITKPRPRAVPIQSSCFP